MQIEIDALKRILRDGGVLNRDTQKLVLSEMISEIETLRVALHDAEYANEAGVPVYTEGRVR